VKALEVRAGPRARVWLRERGLRPQDVRVIPGAAGGPKGLVLNPLDRFLFGSWLASAPQTLHLVGASIGAWRMACACLPHAASALAQMAEDYITQRYDHAPGRPPTPQTVSAAFGRKLDERLVPRAAQILGHPTRRLHVFTSRGRRLLTRDGPLRTPAGYAAAYVANAVRRQALGAWIERVVFSDPRDALPLPLDDFPTRHAALRGVNLASAVLASCSIPFWLRAVSGIPGAPPGAYWDGGITDYHLHLRYGALQDGIVLYPHFQPTVVPGWLDKPWRARHRTTAALDNVVLLSPSAQWIERLPGRKLPDRSDFKTWGDNIDGRQAVWRRALAESERLADEFAQLVDGAGPVHAQVLE
jgi:hypothetical protein